MIADSGPSVKYLLSVVLKLRWVRGAVVIFPSLSPTLTLEAPKLPARSISCSPLPYGGSPIGCGMSPNVASGLLLCLGVETWLKLGSTVKWLVGLTSFGDSGCGVSGLLSFSREVEAVGAATTSFIMNYFILRMGKVCSTNGTLSCCAGFSP
jgi:hypothetical protein